jgi:membrane protease YdiL (CAAX protease family)
MKTKITWKGILHAPFTRLIIGIIIILTVMIAGYQIPIRQLLSPFIGDSPLISIIADLLISCLLLLTYILLFKYYENRTITELSLKSFPRYASLGFLVGFAIQALVIAVIYLFGHYKIVEINPISVLAVPFFTTMTTGVWEEILFRGLIFRLVEEKLGTVISLLISALLFGFAHAWNPGATVFSSVAIALEAGILLGVCYVLTRNLWFPIFLHMAWNFTQGAIFGVEVSGTDMGQQLFTSEISGPEWLTGGAFGPEAAVHTIIICLILAGVMYYKAQKEKQIIAPYWMKKRAIE